MLTSAVENLTSYLGSVWMRPSLEVDDTIGVSRARFRVFFHWPFLGRWSRQAGVFTQLHIRVFGGQAGCEANMLPDQAPTAAPAEGTRIHFNSYLLLITTATKKQACRKHDCNSNCAPSFFFFLSALIKRFLKRREANIQGQLCWCPLADLLYFNCSHLRHPRQIWGPVIECSGGDTVFDSYAARCITHMQ